jgi:DNA-directed RNA polymerase specialized sigma24 family protein
VKKQIEQDMSQEWLEIHRQTQEELSSLRERIGLLSGTDRVLMTMYIDRGASYRQLSELLRISETSVARRIRRLTRRLIDDRYIFCMRNREKLTSLQLRIVKYFLVRGLPMKQIAKKLDVSYYIVRKNMQEALKLSLDPAQDGTATK